MVISISSLYFSLYLFKTVSKMQRGEAMSVHDLLRSKIWYRILTRLPVKSILRCRPVRKKWYSLISSPDFITYQAAQTLNHSTCNRVLVKRCDPIKDLKKFSSHDESFVESGEHDDLLEQLGSGIVQIVGSCNGLVCLLINAELKTDGDCIEVQRFLIWNPSIRKLVELPFRLLPPEHDPYDIFDMGYLLGFGFDSDNGDYKILRVGYFISDEPPYGVPVVSEIFDLRKGVWTAISPPVAPHNDYPSESCVYLRGSLHWIGSESEDRHDYVLASFNLSSEVSQKMGMPDGIVSEDYCNCSVLVNNGFVSVAWLRRQLQGDDTQNYCTVWSMKEYGVAESWTKLFNIDLPYALNHLGLVRFRENGQEVIVGRDGNNALVVYNPQNRTSKALLSPDRYIYKLCFYKESLVLL